MFLVGSEWNPSLVEELEELPKRDGGVLCSPCGATLATLIPCSGPVEEDVAHALLQCPPNHCGPVHSFPLGEQVKASEGLVVKPDGSNGHANMMEYIVFIPTPRGGQRATHQGGDQAKLYHPLG